MSTKSKASGFSAIEFRLDGGRCYALHLLQAHTQHISIYESFHSASGGTDPAAVSGWVLFVT